MVVRILSTKSFHLIFSALVVIGTSICIFTPSYMLFRWGAGFAVHIMLSYLFMGILFLLLRQPKLMFISFMCCSGLCLFLKYASNSSLIYPARTGAKTVKVAHFNLSSSSSDVVNAVDAILKTDADILSFQEYDPQWHDIFQQAISRAYPYQTHILQLNHHDLAVYSRYPFATMDTLFVDGKIPIIKGSILTEGGKDSVYFVSSYLCPPFGGAGKAYDCFKNHLAKISDLINHTPSPIMVFGEFNEVYWSWDLLKFKDRSSLNDSRRFPALGKKLVSHIFYTGHLSCVDFEDIFTSSAGFIGIEGTYQIKKYSDQNVSKPL